MYKKIEKTTEYGEKVTIYWDKNIKKPYMVVGENAGAGICIYNVTTAEAALDCVKIYELRKQFSLEEIKDIKNYAEIEEKSNAELHKKLGIPYLGGKRENSGRKKGSKSTTAKSERTQMFNKRITKEEKIFLEKKLQEYREKED